MEIMVNDGVIVDIKIKFNNNSKIWRRINTWIHERKIGEVNLKGKVTLTIVLGLVCFVLAAVMFAQFKTIENTDITSIEAMRESELRTTLANWKTKYEETEKKLQDTNAKIAEYQEKELMTKRHKNY